MAFLIYTVSFKTIQSMFFVCLFVCFLFLCLFVFSMATYPPSAIFDGSPYSPGTPDFFSSKWPQMIFLDYLDGLGAIRCNHPSPPPFGRMSVKPLFSGGDLFCVWALRFWNLEIVNIHVMTSCIWIFPKLKSCICFSNVGYCFLFVCLFVFFFYFSALLK